MEWFKNFLKSLFGEKSAEVKTPDATPPIPINMPKQDDVTIPTKPSIARPADLPASNHYASKDPILLAKEYAFLFPQVKIKADMLAQARSAAKNILKGKDRYLTVQKATGVPWLFTGLTHYREASLRWNAYLGNGDPWDKVSVHVPAGRGPFKSWEEGAIDALTYQGYKNLQDWSIGAFLRRIEAYNGMGYRINGVHDFQCRKQVRGDGTVRPGTFNGVYHGSMQDTTPKNASPYMYNGTQFYEKGVSIEDHSFYPDAKDDQCGIMAILWALIEAGETVFGISSSGIISQPKPVEPKPSAPPTVGMSRKGNYLHAAVALGLQDAADHTLKVMAEQFPKSDPRYYAIYDIDQHSSKKRLFLIDADTMEAKQKCVAHGLGSDPDGSGYATKFSNVNNSKMSSLGVFRCAEIYSGAHGKSMRLDGLEMSNSLARERAIVMHSANYVTESSAGRSWGCPAVSPEFISEALQKLNGGSFLTIWSKKQSKV